MQRQIRYHNLAVDEDGDNIDISVSIVILQCSVFDCMSKLFIMMISAIMPVVRNTYKHCRYKKCMHTSSFSFLPPLMESCPLRDREYSLAVYVPEPI